MARMRAVDAAVLVLEKEGISCAFGVPGAAINPLYSALKARGTIRHILARHVEAASHMAEGYTRAKAGNIGAVHRHVGPGRHRHDHRALFGLGRFDPDPVHHRPGAAGTAHTRRISRPSTSPRSPRRSPNGRSPCMEPSQVPMALQKAFHLMRSGAAGAGADRPAGRRAAGRDRVRHRRL